MSIFSAGGLGPLDDGLDVLPPPAFRGGGKLGFGEFARFRSTRIGCARTGFGDTTAGALDFVTAMSDFGLFPMDVAPAERSNIPMREVVGGIEVVSNASSGTSLERLMLRPGDRPEVLVFWGIACGRKGC
jgi:hypothetical protein